MDSVNSAFEDDPPRVPRPQLEPRQDEEIVSRRIRLTIGITLAACLVFVVVDSFKERHVEAVLLEFLGWVEQHPNQGVLAVICVYAMATILFVPGSVLTLGAGYAFGSASGSFSYGVFLASTAVFLGASLGSTCTFLLGRYLFRGCVLRLAAGYPIFQAVDRAMQGNGLKIMLLLRLSPLIPYNALDYISGVTGITLLAYVTAFIGFLPGTIALSFLGASMSSLTDTSVVSENRTMKIFTIVSGVVFSLGGVYAASYYSKRELDNILAEESAVNGVDAGHTLLGAEDAHETTLSQEAETEAGSSEMVIT